MSHPAAACNLWLLKKKCLPTISEVKPGEAESYPQTAIFGREGHNLSPVMLNNRFTACQTQPKAALLDLPRFIHREEFKEQRREILIRHANSVVLDLEIGMMLPQVSGHIHVQLILPPYLTALLKRLPNTRRIIGSLTLSHILSVNEWRQVSSLSSPASSTSYSKAMSSNNSVALTGPATMDSSSSFCLVKLERSLRSSTI